jgi:hypothetical protein
MIIVRLLSPEPVGWYQHHQLYPGLGADIVMESITLKTPGETMAQFARLSFPTVMERISLSTARDATAASNIAAFL